MKETTKTPWDIEGKWSVSHFCWAPEVRKEFPEMRKKITIRDDTFREGDHCIGYRISIKDKIELLRLAVEMGVEEIDIGDIAGAAGKVTIYSTDGAEADGYPHPHVDSNGRPCLGNISADLAKAIGRMRIAEALTLGTSTLAVDGVVIIGEHGTYPRNEMGQTLYPRYRFFKEVVKVFEASGRSVPSLIMGRGTVGLIIAPSMWPRLLPFCRVTPRSVNRGTAFRTWVANASSPW